MASVNAVNLGMLFYATVMAGICYGRVPDDVALLQPVPFLCDALADPQSLTSSGCVQGCKMENIMGEPINVTIFDPREEVRAILATCKKLKVSQKFTRTWTFSDIPGSVEETVLEPTWQECWDTWESKCKLGECVTSRPQITPSYSYASTTLIEKIGIVIESHPTSIKVNIQQSAKIYLQGKFIEFNLERYYDDSSKSWTLWQKVGGDKCRIQEEVHTQCLFNSRNIIICDSLGLTINYTSSRPVSVCGFSQSLMVSETGVLYRFGGGGSPFSAPSFPVLNLNADELTETVIKSVQQAHLATKSEICTRSCLQDYVNITGLKYLGGAIISNSTGVVRACRIMRTCKIQKPLLLCSDHNHVRVTCGLSSYWWNMVSLEINTGDTCHRSNPVTSTVLVRVGEGIYKVNETGIYFHSSAPSESVFNFIPARHIEVITPREAFVHLRAAKSSYREGNILDSKRSVSTTNYLADLGRGISQATSDVFSYLSGVKSWIIGVLIVLVSLPILNFLLGGMYNKRRYEKVKFII